MFQKTLVTKRIKSGTEDESVPLFAESKDVKLDLILDDRMAKNQNDDIVQDEVSDEGWQEAFPKGGARPGAARFPLHRRTYERAVAVFAVAAFFEAFFDIDGNSGWNS
ncbi:hypothetical protein RHMOL_Rhmol01G0018800 [Rhododendron molle]|uniref:Uncharacterized protein n=1 Tax=Rhododendron molle TaxID=49168 RepID=A0ACC0PXN4_RHOML|nr:hypothetical protein RHMOL_Rhmol01G0018800 [Rhododendron molle]